MKPEQIILFVHQSAEMYGSDKVLLYLVQGLHAGGDFHPIVVLPENGPLYVALLAAGIEVHIAAVAKISRSIMSPAGIFRLAQEVLKGVRGIDKVVGKRQIALVHSNTLAVLSGAIWAALRRKQHIWHVHEIILEPKLVSKGYPWLVRLLSDSVISNSTLTERWLLSGQASLTSKSIVVFNGLPNIAKPSEVAILAFRDRVGASADEVVVTLAGRINRWKGQELLVQAAAELQHRDKVTGFRFVIVGDAGPGLEHLLAQLQAQVMSFGLERYFTFLPFVDDVWPVWFGTDICVVPSTQPEPFGMVAIEAMAAAVPVIAAGHGGLLDIVVNDKTGQLFTPRSVTGLADALQRLGSNSSLRRSFGAAGLNRQREFFSVDSQVERTKGVYMELLHTQGCQ